MGNKKVVPFNYNAGISRELIHKLLEKGKSFGLTEVFPFAVEKIKLAEWVHLKCRYGCNQYDNNWCCPPATPTITTVRGILKEYSRAVLLVGSHKSPDSNRDNLRKRSMRVRCWKGTISLERMLFLNGFYKAFSLVGESCALCKTCAYPEDCKFPQEKRPSVESFSIDVIGTLRSIGKYSEVNDDINNQFNYYGIILVE